MAIDMNSVGALQAYQNTNKLNPNSEKLEQQGVKEKGNSAFAPGQEISADKITIRNERQASLVAHLFGDGKNANESSLKLTFQAAIEKLNEVLREDMGIEKNGTSADPISKKSLKEQGGMEYWTPENTAKRIVDGSTAFLAGFQSAHPELEGEELMNRFLEVVGGGITKGFEEAKGILGDLNVLEGDIESNIDSTYSFVQTGLQNFRNQYLGISEPATNTGTTDTQTAVNETETTRVEDEKA